MEQKQLLQNTLINYEKEMRYLGWFLLIIWLFAIIYMTRDFWFPNLFQSKSKININ